MPCVLILLRSDMLFCNVVSVTNFDTFQEYPWSIPHPKRDPLIDLLSRKYHAANTRV